MGWHGSAACSAEGLKSFRTSGSRLNSLEPHWPVPTDSFMLLSLSAQQAAEPRFFSHLPRGAGSPLVVFMLASGLGSFTRG